MTLRWREFLLLLLIAVAFVPRALPPREMIDDEANYWIKRSNNFLTGLRTGQLEMTMQTYHPGVTTMWLAAMGMVAVQVSTGTAPETSDDFYFYYDYLEAIHIPFAVVNTVVILMAYWFMRRLWGGRIALMAAFIWAVDPYLVGYQRVVHIDGLVTSFMTLSFLSGLIAFRFDHPPHDIVPRWRWVVASGVFGALATLSKFTGLYVLPALFTFVILRHYLQHRKLNFSHEFRKALLYWILAFIVTCVLLLPAVWAAPLLLLGHLKFAFELAYEEHTTFFAGQVVDVAGPHMYLAVLLLRMTPWVMVGLVIAGFAAYRRQVKGQHLLWLVLYIVLYWAATSLQTKKLGRYILPAFPMMYIIASIGLLWLWDRLRISKGRYSGVIVSAVGVLVIVANIIWYHPYPLSYFNPLVGGARTAQQMILVGQGEGLRDTFQYINAQGSCADGIMVDNINIAQAHTNCPVYNPSIAGLDVVDFLVIYINERQRELFVDVLDHLGNPQPDYVSNIHGVEFAHVYDLKQYTAPQGLETAGIYPYCEDCE